MNGLSYFSDSRSNLSNSSSNVTNNMSYSSTNVTDSSSYSSTNVTNSSSYSSTNVTNNPSEPEWIFLAQRSILCRCLLYTSPSPRDS